LHIIHCYIIAILISESNQKNGPVIVIEGPGTAKKPIEISWNPATGLFLPVHYQSKESVFSELSARGG